MKISQGTKSCLRDAAEIVLFLIVSAMVIFSLAVGLIEISTWIRDSIYLRRESQVEVDRPTEGVGRVPEVTRYLDDAEDSEYISLEEYTEGESPVPVWWNPEEPMSVEWEANDQQVTEVNEEAVFEDYEEEMAETEQVRYDAGCPDYNYEMTLYGWNGHTAERWELDLFSRIFYLEFWQPNLTLCEAGCDAMFQLWDLNGGTMFETLSYVNENGSYAYSTYPGVWDEDYDPDGLAWCKAFCEERFYEGPTWPAQYFRKGQYHDWQEWSPIPAYEIDGIYFSIGRSW